MAVLKFMSVLTTCSVFAALLSIIWQAFISLKQLNRVTTISIALLAIESSLKSPIDAPKPKVALGYGACTDLVISATEFLNYTASVESEMGPEFTVDEINDEKELLQTFAYYFQKGAAAERIMPNKQLFSKLLHIAKTRHRDNIQWYLGGNAPLMGMRLFQEGADVLLGARMSHKLRRLVPAEIKIAGDQIAEDDIHIILEYKAGEKWGAYTAPRANRYILHSDQNNPHLNSLEQFDLMLRQFQPKLLVISGLQMMDTYKFPPGVRETRLLKVQEQITTQTAATMQHFEMASYVELDLLLLLRNYILPHVDSLGMNEQELENLAQVLQFGRNTLASDSNPRVATTLDQMRKVYKHLATEYFKNMVHKSMTKRRLISRIHVHTLAYQALLTLRNSPWKNSRAAAAKAALTAHRYVCQNDMVNPESATLVLDNSFATSTIKNGQRIQLDPQNPVPCWNETIEILSNRKLDIEICVAPVLVCRIAKKTAGAGDNISAAALSQQL